MASKKRNAIHACCLAWILNFFYAKADCFQDLLGNTSPGHIIVALRRCSEGRLTYVPCYPAKGAVIAELHDANSGGRSRPLKSLLILLSLNIFARPAGKPFHDVFREHS